MIRYSRWSPPGTVDDVEAHVRAHLSSVATPDDNPDTYAAAVSIERLEDTERWGKSGLLVVGHLDAAADAPYLLDGFDPEQDATGNPLSVPSINEGEAL